MPRTWHDNHAINKIENEDKKYFYRSLSANKKPYFMRYIYPALMKQYNTYIKNTNKSSLREFKMTVDELKAIPHERLNDRQKEFLFYYDKRMPVGIGDCVMNKICRRFENEFDGHIRKHNSSVKFDYRIMKNEGDYNSSLYYKIKHLYDEYNSRLKNYKVFIKYERVDKWDSASELQLMDDDFKRECDMVCSNENTLCNILLDMCYAKNATKRFVWSMCDRTIIQNLLKRNDNIISFPVADQEGDINYGGNKFKLISVEGVIDD